MLKEKAGARSQGEAKRQEESAASLSRETLFMKGMPAKNPKK